MTPEQHIAILHSLFGLLLLWFLVYYCWREYRIDALRQELFAIRDEMFLYAADGGVSFTHPAYTKLRTLMNGMIRFAHRVTFVRLVVSVLVHTLAPNPDSYQPYREWRQAMSTLPEEPRKRLECYHLRVHASVLRHMVSGSLVLFALVAIFGVVHTVYSLIHGSIAGFRRTLVAFESRVPGVGSGIELIEDQAQHALPEDLGRRRGPIAATL